MQEKFIKKTKWNGSITVHHTSACFSRRVLFLAGLFYQGTNQF